MQVCEGFTLRYCLYYQLKILFLGISVYYYQLFAKQVKMFVKLMKIIIYNLFLVSSVVIDKSGGDCLKNCGGCM